MPKFIKQIIIVVGVFMLIQVLASSYFYRIDLTSDKRYTISEATKSLFGSIDKTILVEVYLEGDFPAEFRRLAIETKQYLEDLKVYAPKLRYRFVDPEGKEQRLIDQGMEPTILQVDEEGKRSEIVIFPWAKVTIQGAFKKVALLKDIIANTQEQQMQSSIENLEYAFGNVVQQLSNNREKSIAIIKGNGELEDLYLMDFLRSVKEYYKLGQITLDSAVLSPVKTLRALNDYDLAIIAKPTETFSIKEKYLLDQYTMQGGKSLWLIDAVQAEMDSLLVTGEALAYPRDLKLTDLLFSYGVRVEKSLVKDMYAAKIPLATGKKKYNTFPWLYYPIIQPSEAHPISRNTDPVKVTFGTSITMLDNGIKKSVLLQSSSLSNTVGTPKIISLEEVREQPKPGDFTKEQYPMGVLLEGVFTSSYKGRTKPFDYANALEESVPTKMAVFSDGDLIANELNSKGTPYLLGYDKITRQVWGNKNLLLQTIQFLMDEKGLVSLRSKEIDLKTLSKERTYEERNFWRWFNGVVPLFFIFSFGVIFYFWRKNKYA